MNLKKGGSDKAMIKVRHRGNFKHAEKLFNNVTRKAYLNDLGNYGELGVKALSEATPVDSGKTANSWTFDIEKNRDNIAISWLNTNEVDGVSVAFLLQYGHGTGTGKYVRGRDYINPAMRPVFDEIADGAWKGVISE